MKLDLEIIRELLLHIEEHADRPISDLRDIRLTGRSALEVQYHIVIASEDGLISASIDKLSDEHDPELLNVTYSVRRLTARGHELLGIIRESKNWRIIKENAKTAGVATVGAMFSFAQAYLLKLAGM